MAVSAISTNADERCGVAARNLPPADADSLWTYIIETDPYREWAVWPGYEELVKGASHSVWLRTYANEIAIEGAREGGMLPYGSIIVKDNFAEDRETLKVVSPMHRVEGFNPEGGDWFWVNYGGEGKVMAAGKVKACIDCHTADDD